MPGDGPTVMNSWFEAWNRADLDAFSELYAVDAEMTLPEGWVETGVLAGRAEIRRFFEGLKEAWDGEDSAVLREMFTAGDALVSRMEWHVRGRVSGIDSHIAVTNVNTIENGQIVSQQHYLEHAEALAALGLSE
jgi:ketosteroid isomerase-like protein